MNSTKDKIFSLEQLKNKIFLEKKRKKTIVHCHGVFDVLHYGHIKHFKSAKKNGDFLIVSITSDEFVNKGKGRPIFNSLIRAEVLSSISSIDAVHINRDKTPINLMCATFQSFFQRCSTMYSVFGLGPKG